MIGLVSALHNAHDEAKKLRDGLTALGASMGGTVGQDADKLMGRLEEISKQADEIQKNSTGVVENFRELARLPDTGSLAGNINQVKSFFGGERKENEATERQAKALAKAFARDYISARTRELDLAKGKFALGDEEIEPTKLRVEYAKRRDALSLAVANNVMPATEGNEAKRLLREEFQLRLRIFERQQAERVEGVAAESHILQIQRDGEQVALRTAKVRLDAANATLRRLPKSGAEHDRAQLDRDQAQSAYDELRLAEFNKSPEQRAAERQAYRDRQNQIGRMNAQDRRKAELAAANRSLDPLGATGGGEDAIEAARFAREMDGTRTGDLLDRLRYKNDPTKMVDPQAAQNEAGKEMEELGKAALEIMRSIEEKVSLKSAN